MQSRKTKIRSNFRLETLEGRLAPSSFGGMHRNDRAVEIQHLRRGADDPANHDVNDNRGRGRGADDPANHDVNDNRGRGPGADDPANHDVNDDRGRHGLGHR